MADRNQLLNDSEEAFRIAFDGREACLWTAMPGIIEAVDLVAMTCSIQPSIQGVVANEDGSTENVNMPLLIHVPICFPQAGGFVMTFPMVPGDEVLVVFASRCIDSWWQSGGIGVQSEVRMHDLSDGFAIPGPFSQPNVIPSISTTGAQLRNRAGTTYVEISADGGIKLVSPTAVTVPGDLIVTGTIATTGGLTNEGIPFASHVHGGVTTGSGSTGVPV